MSESVARAATLTWRVRSDGDADAKGGCMREHAGPLSKKETRRCLSSGHDEKRDESKAQTARLGTSNVGANERVYMKKCCSSGDRRGGQATCGDKLLCRLT